MLLLYQVGLIKVAAVSSYPVPVLPDQHLRKVAMRTVHIGLYFSSHIQTIRKKPTLHLCMKWPQVCVPGVAATGHTLAHSHSHAACGPLLPAQIFCHIFSTRPTGAAHVSQGRCCYIWLAGGTPQDSLPTVTRAPVRS